MKSRRDGYTEETVAALVAAGRRRFGEDGFAATSLEEIAADAGVTTGAIYHHFAGKKGLFQTVAEALEQELLELARGAAGDDPWTTLERAFEVLLDACAAPDVQRILFLDAPRVIGPEAWREIESKYAYGAMSLGLSALIEAGVMRSYPVELLAPTLLAVLSECSRMIAKQRDARPAALDVLLWVLNGLRKDGGLRTDERKALPLV